MSRPLRVFRYAFRYEMGWTWTCSSCGRGHSSPQWGVWDTQSAALIAALQHCRKARLS